jgi:hypothetical protein
MNTDPKLCLQVKTKSKNFSGVDREEDPGIDDDPEHDPRGGDPARSRDRGVAVERLDPHPPRPRKRKNARHPSRLSRSLLPKECGLELLLHIDDLKNYKIILQHSKNTLIFFTNLFFMICLAVGLVDK